MHSVDEAISLAVENKSNKPIILVDFAKDGAIEDIVYVGPNINVL